MLMPVPKKYAISCTDRRDGSTILKKEFEAINRAEAEARGLLNCIRSGGERGNIDVRAVRA